MNRVTEVMEVDMDMQCSMSDGEPASIRHIVDDEPVLRVGPHDKLPIRWGSVVVQRTGAHLKEFSAERNVCILIFVNKGKLRLQIDSTLFTVCPGQALITLPGEMCFSMPHESDLQFQWMCFEHRRTGRRSRNSNIDVPRISAIFDRDTFREVFRLLVVEYQRHEGNKELPGQLDRMGAQLMLRSLLARMSSAPAESLQDTSPLTLLVERARSYMRTHHQEPYTIADIAEHLECSKEYLRIAFRHSFGKSPKQYLIDLQMGRAQYQLIHTRRTIGEIAHELGYDSPSYFARVFARRYGTSPTDYRLANGKDYLTGGI